MLNEILRVAGIWGYLVLAEAILLVPSSLRTLLVIARSTTAHPTGRRRRLKAGLFLLAGVAVLLATGAWGWHSVATNAERLAAHASAANAQRLRENADMAIYVMYAATAVAILPTCVGAAAVLTGLRDQ